jgi:(E)-4-hydroxy-3-methylbut-2-enyl-diphosphate synthase
MATVSSDPRVNAANQTIPDRLLRYCPSPYRYQRRQTHVVHVGKIAVGGDEPIRVQSMTTTSTLDTAATVAQVERLVRVGCEIVRITAPTVKDARNLGEIKNALIAKGIDVPLVADIHFSPDAALVAADFVEKVRVNPGNYADTRKFAARSYTDAEYAAELARIEERFAPLVLKCKAKSISMRIGTNHGSLSDRIVNRFGDTPEGMCESALEFVRICEKYGYFDVILSMKASNVKVMIAAYRLLAARMGALGMTYPFHLGVTEAGNGEDGRLKSVIGIGSLLADGIGDTIRVSLTEEPEEEVPVAFAIANHFAVREHPISRPDVPLPLAPSPTGRGGKGEGYVPWNPYHYERRSSRSVQCGPIAIGGGGVLAVVARVGSDGAARVLRWASPGARRLRRPDIVEWPVRDAADAAALADARGRLAQATLSLLAAPEQAAAQPKLAILASSRDANLLAAALPAADGVLFELGDVAACSRLAHATAAAGKPLWLEARVTGAEAAGRAGPNPLAPFPPREGGSEVGGSRSSPFPGREGGEGVRSGPPRDDDELIRSIDAVLDELLAAAEACRAAGQRDLVLSVTTSPAEAWIVAQRRLAARLAQLSDDTPVFLRTAPTEERLLETALPLGSLLADGFGDVIQAGTPAAGQVDVELGLNVLQAAGTRLSKTDYVACPSCGRTLFDLQSTTERIKTKTSHLVGVKIAIMGCVVNGPGEMADADFGYVGGAPGQVNLYVGRNCVERGVPADVADDRLVELIKSHGRWKEPEPIDGSESEEG